MAPWHSPFHLLRTQGCRKKGKSSSESHCLNAISFSPDAYEKFSLLSCRASRWWQNWISGSLKSYSLIWENTACFHNCIHCIFWVQAFNLHCCFFQPLRYKSFGMYRDNLLQYLHFHSAEAQNPCSVLLSPRPGSIPSQSTRNLGRFYWLMSIYLSMSIPLLMSIILLMIKNTQANRVWMTLVRVTLAPKWLDSPEGCFGWRWVLCLQGNITQKCTKDIFELFLSLPSSPDYLRAFRSCIKQHDKHSEEENVSASKLLSKGFGFPCLGCWVWEAEWKKHF